MAMVDCRPYICTHTGHESTLQYHTPTTREELQKILKAAAQENKKLCAISGSPDVQRCYCESDNIVSLKDLEREIMITSETSEVTVGVAVPLRKLQAELANVGLTLPCQSIDTESTVGEALMTGQHSSDCGMGSLSRHVEKIRVMTASGELVTAFWESFPELFRTLGGVGLGEGPVILTVTMTGRKVESLIVNQYPVDLHQILECFAVHCSASKYFSFSWFPNGGCVARHCRPDTQEHKQTGNGFLRNVMYTICDATIYWTSWFLGSQWLLSVGNWWLFYFGYSKHIVFKPDIRNGPYCSPKVPSVDRYYKKEWYFPGYVVPVVMSELEARIENEKRPVHRVDVTLAGGYDVDLNPASGIRATVSLAVSRAIPQDVADTVFFELDDISNSMKCVANNIIWHADP